MVADKLFDLTVEQAMQKCAPPLPADLYGTPFIEAAAALKQLKPGLYDALEKNVKASARVSSIAIWRGTVATTLRDELGRLREEEQQAQAKAAAQGAGAQTNIIIPELVRYQTAIADGAELLDAARAFIKRFVVVNASQAVAMTLWAAWTHAFEIADRSPRLAFQSPKYRCGKTTAMDVVGYISAPSIGTSNITPSALFRLIEMSHPLLRIDELESFSGTKKIKSERTEELRGILNSGHKRNDAYVIRNEKIGDKQVPVKFSTWAPICYAAIGRLSQTWEDRSIIIRMKRRKKSEAIERIGRRNESQIEAEGAVLASKLARWIHDNLDALRVAVPALPPALDDRASDNWDLLLAIADLAGGTWGADARTAAAAISGETRPDADDGSIDIQLLSDIREIINGSSSYNGAIGSTELCDCLKGKGGVWATFARDGTAIKPHSVARMLKEFEVYTAETNKRSEYRTKDLRDAFERYLISPAQLSDDPSSVLAPESQILSATVPQPLRGEGEYAPQQSATRGSSENAETPTGRKTNGTMALKNGKNGSAPQRGVIEGDDELDRLARADGWNPQED